MKNNRSCKCLKLLQNLWYYLGRKLLPNLWYYLRRYLPSSEYVIGASGFLAADVLNINSIFGIEINHTGFLIFVLLISSISSVIIKNRKKKKTGFFSLGVLNVYDELEQATTDKSWEEVIRLGYSVCRYLEAHGQYKKQAVVGEKVQGAIGKLIKAGKEEIKFEIGSKSFDISLTRLLSSVCINDIGWPKHRIWSDSKHKVRDNQKEISASRCIDKGIGAAKEEYDLIADGYAKLTHIDGECRTKTAEKLVYGIETLYNDISKASGAGDEFAKKVFAFLQFTLAETNLRRKHYKQARESVEAYKTPEKDEKDVYKDSNYKHSSYRKSNNMDDNDREMSIRADYLSEKIKFAETEKERNAIKKLLDQAGVIISLFEEAENCKNMDIYVELAVLFLEIHVNRLDLLQKSTPDYQDAINDVSGDVERVYRSAKDVCKKSHIESEKALDAQHDAFSRL